ncbi:MAG: hypothetical protein ACKVJK_19770 [Methylophagaceae bacterium]
MSTRDYSSRRMAIVQAMGDKLKLINGNFPYRTNLYGNVLPRLKFWDEVEDFPAVHVSAGSETRQYQGGGYKDRYLTVTIRVYVSEEDAVFALEKLFEDIETVLEDNAALSYTDQDGATQGIQQITILSLDTDEGALEPLAVGEIICEVRY